MRPRLLTFLVLGLALCASVRAGDDLWSGLVLATNEAPAGSKTPRKLEAFAPALERMFGYRHLVLLDDTRKPLKGRFELATSPHFSVRGEVLAREPGRYRLALEFLQGPQTLLSTEVLLARGVPLLVRGPQAGSGQLVFVVVIR